MYQITKEKKRMWTEDELRESIRELEREARIRQFVYQREHARYRASRGKEGISEGEGARRWKGLMIAISVLYSLLEFKEVHTEANVSLADVGGEKHGNKTFS